MHDFFLSAALDQARHGLGFCAPNPSVGAVVVKKGEIIAQAWHRGAGLPHAEQLVINQLPAQQSGLTLYVTLEPCNHQGRTPPCVEAIHRYGFERVVFACRDPNPLVKKNNTPEWLTQRGIEVHHHPLPAIDEFYRSYRHWILTGKPWVTAKIAQSFDGKIAAVEGGRLKITNDACAQFTHQNRLTSDILLTTAQTVNADDPQLNARLAGQEPVKKPVAIIDSQLRLKQDAVVLSTASHCHIFYDASRERPSEVGFNRTFHPISTIDGVLDLEQVMGQLGAIGYHSVWVEAGGGLFSALHQAKLVHQTYVYLAPRILGEKAVSAYHFPELFQTDSRVTWIPMADNMVARLDHTTGVTCLPA